MKKHVAIDKVENGYWCRYTNEKGEQGTIIVFETYLKLETFLCKYLEVK